MPSPESSRANAVKAREAAQAKTAAKRRRYIELRIKGLSVAEAAAEMEISEPTARRYEHALKDEQGGTE